MHEVYNNELFSVAVTATDQDYLSLKQMWRQRLLLRILLDRSAFGSGRCWSTIVKTYLF